jgi:hypothetical protein
VNRATTPGSPAQAAVKGLSANPSRAGESLWSHDGDVCGALVVVVQGGGVSPNFFKNASMVVDGKVVSGRISSPDSRSDTLVVGSAEGFPTDHGARTRRGREKPGDGARRVRLRRRTRVNRRLKGAPARHSPTVIASSSRRAGPLPGDASRA